MTPLNQLSSKHWMQAALTLGGTSAFTAALILAAGCGKAPTTSAGGVSLVAAPLAGANAASLAQPKGFTFASIADSVTSGLLSLLVGNQSAYAAVSSFNSFKICNDTLVITDSSGNTVAVNGSTNQAGLGLLTFTSASTTNTTLASLSIAAGTKIKEIDITSAISTTLCPGFSDAVAFDDGVHSVAHISQNTAFKFTYSTPVTITGSAQNLTLLFGQIVTGMVALGTGLNNSTIQTVNVGQAQ